MTLPEWVPVQAIRHPGKLLSYREYLYPFVQCILPKIMGQIKGIIIKISPRSTTLLPVFRFLKE